VYVIKSIYIIDSNDGLKDYLTDLVSISENFDINKFKVFESFAEKDYISIGCISSCLLPNNTQDQKKLMEHISLMKFEKIDDKFKDEILEVTRDVFEAQMVTYKKYIEASAPHWNIRADHSQYNIPKVIPKLIVNIADTKDSLVITKLEDHYIWVSIHTNRHHLGYSQWYSFICDVSDKYIGYKNLLEDIKLNRF
jgi:hypothetical protein